MTVLGKTPGFVEAIVRWVECRCLLGGVTTSQGIALASNAGIQRYYRGVVRNVERGDLPTMASAGTHIPDIDAKDAASFLKVQQHKKCLLLHLSEGTDAKAHAHFEALKIDASTWAITPSLSGIHCVALTKNDFKVMHDHGASMVWSPTSNLLLYGATADIAAAKDAGMRIALGCDWAPSGTKNLLGELKVARAVSHDGGDVFTDQELVDMVTRTAAEVLSWSKDLGTLEPGKLADLIVVDGRTDDPYAQLIGATESSLQFVMINGVPRLGTPGLMTGSANSLEKRTIGGNARVANLQDDAADPLVAGLTLAAAEKKLQLGLKDLVKLAKALEKPKSFLAHVSGAPQWSLVLEHEEPAGIAERPHLPFKGQPTAVVSETAKAAKPLSQVLQPMKLAPLTMVDDADFLPALSANKNFPAYALKALTLAKSAHEHH
jgi:hypothetical protein